MTLLWGAVVGVLLGWIVGGRLRNLEGLHLRAGWLILLALVIQALIFPLGHADPLLPYATVPLHFLSYGLLALFLGLNLRHWPLGLLALGLVANLAAIAANGGYMPAAVEALRKAGMEGAAEALLSQGKLGNVVLMGTGTKLNWLGDWLWLPHWVPLAMAFSPGDLLIGLGLACFIPYGMRMRER
jgi:hypothetical protein